MSKKVNLELYVELVEYLQRVLIINEEKLFDRLDKQIDNDEYLVSMISLNRMIQVAIEDALHDDEEENVKDVKRGIGFKVADKENEEEEEVELEEGAYDDGYCKGFQVPPSELGAEPEDDYAFYTGEEI